MTKKLLPATTKRVFLSTHPDINSNIRSKTIQSLNLYKDSNRELISDKIKKTHYEWDTERCLETNAALLVFISSIIGLKTNKSLFFITATIGIFLLQHALFGWCPPLPVIRKAGVRTSDEINHEKIVLKMLRGDFKQNSMDVAELLLAAEK